MFMLLRTLSCALLFFSFLYALKNFVMRVASARVFDSRKPLGFRRCHAFFFYALKNFVMRVASARVFDSRKPLGFRRCHAFFFYALKNFVMRVASARVFDSSARVFDVLESLRLSSL